MEKSQFKEVKLGKGVMHIYDFGTIKMHAYQTNDFLNDEVFLFEKNGKLVMLEAPAFFENNIEIEEYINSTGLNFQGIILSYHMAGGSLFPNAKKYATKNAEEYGLNGGGKGLMDNFISIWPDLFDREVHKVTDYLESGKCNIGGIDFIITETSEAFDVEIPEINVVYTHMLGHDCHSIVAGKNHAEAIISQLNGYLSKGYEFILSSHYTPENLKNVEEKIAYIKDLIEISNNSSDKQDFYDKVNEKYSNYGGQNYLEMTSGFFFS